MSVQGSFRRRVAAALAQDLSIIRGEFAARMRAQGYRAHTIGLYQRSLVRIATWLAAHRRRNLSSIRGDDVCLILNDLFVRRYGCRTMTRHRPALHR